MQPDGCKDAHSIDFENQGRHFPVQSELHQMYFGLLPGAVEVTTAITYTHPNLSYCFVAEHV
jgi:hypothetical protein